MLEVDQVMGVLRPEDQHPSYRGLPIPAGCCYVVAEALRHLLGDEWKPTTVRHEGCVHWYLTNRTSGEVLDPTVGQFVDVPPYENGRGRGFLTAQPSKRAQRILARLGEEIEDA